MKYFLIVCIFLFIVTPDLYAQTKGGAETGKVEVKGTVSIQQVGPNPCTIIPQEIDIVHIPAKNWHTGADTLKTVQETLGLVKDGAKSTIRFIGEKWNNLVNQNDTDQKNVDDEQNRSSSILEEVAYAQFILAKFIQSNPNTLVFHEFLTHIYDSRYLDTLKIQMVASDTEGTQPIKEENGSSEYLFRLVEQEFPDGLPDGYFSLNDNQKYTLALVGGAHTLLFTGALPIIFPSISATDYKRIYQSDCNSSYNIIRMCQLASTHVLDTYRAEKLAEVVNRFLDGHSTVTDGQKAVAVLIYNDDIDLQAYFPYRKFYKLPDHCLSVKSN